MKYLKYILIIFILFLTPKVYASEFNMNSYTSATNGGTKNRYRATEIYNTGISSTYTFGTRYNGRISDIETYFDYPFEKNTTYRLTYNMSTEDFRNNFDGAYWWDCDDSTQVNPNRSSVSYISYKKIQVSFRPTENTTCIRMWIKSTSLSNVAITGVNNWNLSNITIYDPDWQSGSGSGQGSSSPTPTPTSGASNQDIINNQNNNTQDIINNNTQNTSDIIENNNENTNKIIDSMTNDCENLINLPDLSLNKDNNRTYSYYLPVTLPSGTYTLSYKYNSTGSPTAYVQILLNSSSKLDLNLTSSGKNTFTINSDFNRFYILISSDSSSGSTVSLSNLMLVNGSSSKTYCEYGSKLSKLDETNSFLTDDSNPNISDSEFTSLFDSVTITNPLNSLLQLPVQFINVLVNQSNTCQVVNLGTLLGVPISLPCVNIGSIVGSIVWDTIDILSSIGLIVLILKQLYESITNALTLGGYMDAKKGGLGYMSPLEFLCDIITGFGGDF